MMWLKLTGAGSGDKQSFNFDNVITYENSVCGSVLICSGGKDFVVTESIEEIELMLKGVASAKSDPRARDVIGGRDNDKHYGFNKRGI